MRSDRAICVCVTGLRVTAFATAIAIASATAATTTATTTFAFFALFNRTAFQCRFGLLLGLALLLWLLCIGTALLLVGGSVVGFIRALFVAVFALRATT